MGKQESWFPHLPQKTVFVAAPGDMAYLREAVKQELDDLKKRAADDHNISLYLWEIDKAKDGFSVYVPAQADIPLPSDPNCVAVICIFGERVGTPLPRDFPLEPLGETFALGDESQYRLLHPWPGGAGGSGTERAFPLTGSIFEYLTAASDEKKKPLLLIFIGDQSILNKEERLLNKKWGLWRLRKAARKLYGEDEEGYDDWKIKELRPQLIWLNNFLRYLIDDRGIFIDPLGSEEAARVKIREFLKSALDIKTVEADRYPFKHLEAYGVLDNPIFFGRKGSRERAVREIEFLLNEPRKLPFYGITGVSGAGKSSFLRAGIVAHLTHTLTTGRFVGAVVKPSELLPLDHDTDEHDPLVSIYTRCLESVQAFNPRVNVSGELEGLKVIKEEYRPAHAAARLINALDAQGGNSWRLILGIDQLEECLDELGTVRGETRWKSTLEFIEHAVRSKYVLAVYSVANNRLDKLHNNRTLNSLFNEGSYLALPFPEDEIDEIIQNPFHYKELELERPLADQLRENILSLVADVPSSGNASILPLISVTLSRMYDHWQAQDGKIAAPDPAALSSQSAEPDGAATSSGLTGQFSKALPLHGAGVSFGRTSVLTLAEYQSFINFSDCINLLGTQALQQAESKAGNVRNQERVLASILRRLVRLSPSDVKALSLRSAIIPDNLRATPIFRALLANRLIVEGAGGRVRLVHESVLQYWGKAHEWAEEERDRISMRTQLMLTASPWNEQGRPSEILSGLGDNEINGAAGLLAHWGDDLAPKHVEGTNDEEDLLLRDFLLATLITHPRPRAVIPRDKQGSTHLYAAAFAGAADVVRRYLEIDPACADLRRAGDDRTALLPAATAGQVEVLELLLEHGAPVNQPDKEGWAPLHSAAYEGKLRALDLLLERGADPLQRGPEGWQALHIAVHTGDDAVVARLLADDRVEPNQRNESRWTPLHIAAHYGHEAVVARLLADERTRPNPRGPERETPLHNAAGNGQEAVVARLLADQRVEPDHRTIQRLTSLHMAAQNGHEAVVALLLADERVEPNWHRAWRLTPLHLAAQHDHRAVVERLLADPRVKPDTLDSTGRKPFEVTTGEEVATLLFKAGVELPFWSRASYDSAGQISAVRRMSEAELSQKLTADLRADFGVRWPMAPLLEGDWAEVEDAEAVELLSRAVNALPLGFGEGLSHIGMVRKLRLPFYARETHLVEAMAHRGEAFAGYLTFLHHPEGVTILDGTSPPIHMVNYQLPLALDDAAKALAYLRFFCSVVTGEEGAFTIVESPEQLLWMEGADEETKRRVEGFIRDFELVESVETEDGPTWKINATIHYSNAVFNATFRVMKSGMVDMLNDEPLATDLKLLTEVFASGLRTLRPATKQEEQEGEAAKRDSKAEMVITVLRRLADIVGGDLLLTLEQARVMADVFTYPGTSSAESESRLGIDPSRILSATEYLLRKNAIHAESQAGGEPSGFYPNANLEPIFQQATIFFSTYNIDHFLIQFQIAMAALPEDDKTVTACLLIAYLNNKGNLDFDELLDLVASPDADQVVDVFDKCIRYGLINKTPANGT